jgi:hypothetical protein
MAVAVRKTSFVCLVHFPVANLPQAVGQLCSTSSMAHNLAQCQILVRKAVIAGAKVNFFKAPLLFLFGALEAPPVNSTDVRAQIKSKRSISAGPIPSRSIGLHSLVARGDGLSGPLCRGERIYPWSTERSQGIAITD